MTAHIRRWRTAFLLVVLGCGCCEFAPLAPAVGATRAGIHTVAVMGQPINGLPAELQYSGGGYGIYRSIGGGGHVVFDGGLTSSPDEQMAVWRQDANGSTRLVAREGSQAPEMPMGAVFSEGFWYIGTNSSGDVVFTGNVTGTLQARGVWVERKGVLDLVAGTGMPAPGLPGAKFNTAEYGWINDAGHVIVTGWTVPTGAPPNTTAKAGLWTQTAGGDLRLLASESLGAPGGASFAGLGFPVIDDDGRSILYLATSKPNGLARAGIWAGYDHTDLHPLVQVDDAYAGLDQGVFSFISSYPQLDATGGAVFAANVYSPASGTLSGIWRVDENGVRDVLRTDTISPNVPGFDYNYWGVSNPVVSASGKMAFPGRLQYDVGVSDLNNDGIWQRSPDGAVSLVAREGDSFPGAEPNERLWMWPDPAPMINSLGQVAFLGYITPAWSQFFDGSAIFAQDRQGILQIIVRDGDIIDVDNGPGTDLRTVKAVAFTAPSSTAGDSFPDGLNDRGEVYFEATFTDGTRGFFISQIVAIPEPQSQTILLILTAISSAARRKRRLATRAIL